MYANKSFLLPDGEKAGLEIAQGLADKEVLMPGRPIVLVTGQQPGVIGGTDTIRVRILE
jgi:pyruvate kinase